MQFDKAAALRLKAVTEADPGALCRVLQFFQVRNVTPRRVTAQRMGTECLEIDVEIDAAELTPDGLRVIVAKMNELPIVVEAAVCK